MKRIIALSLAFVLAFAMAFACVAAEVTPSVTAKETPDVNSVKVTAADGTVTEVADADVKITSLADANNGTAADTDIAEALKTAYADITAGELDKVIKEAAKAIDKSFTADNLDATDLFDITLDTTVNGKVLVNFSDTTDAVIHLNTEKNEWVAVAQDNIKKNADGTMDVTFDTLCPIVFLSVNDAPVAEGSNTALIIIIVVVVVVVVAAVVVVLVLKKKKAAKKK